MITGSRRKASSLSFFISAVAVAFLTVMPWTPPARPERDLALPFSDQVSAVASRESSALGSYSRPARLGGESAFLAARPGVLSSRSAAVDAGVSLAPFEAPAVTPPLAVLPRLGAVPAGAVSARSPPVS